MFFKLTMSSIENSKHLLANMLYFFCQAEPANPVRVCKIAMCANQENDVMLLPIRQKRQTSEEQTEDHSHTLGLF